MKLYLVLFLSMTSLLTGCTTTVNVAGTVPTPLVGQIPANVGIYYDENFKNFQHTEAIDAEGTWKINLGDQNFTFFQNLMNSMFENVTVLDDPNPASSSDAGATDGTTDATSRQNLDAILIPKIEKYGFLTPTLSGLKFFSASIHYRITMVDAEGNELADWTVVGYGKSEGGAFSGDTALGAATMMAIRDGGARIAIGLPKEPKVAAWVAEQENADEK